MRGAEASSLRPRHHACLRQGAFRTQGKDCQGEAEPRQSPGDSGTVRQIRGTPPYRYRARVVAAVGAALTLAVFLGAITGSNGWVAPLTAGMFSGTASFICQTLELSPPRELMFVMALLAATAIPADATQAFLRAAVFRISPLSGEA